MAIRKKHRCCTWAKSGHGGYVCVAGGIRDRGKKRAIGIHIVYRFGEDLYEVSGKTSDNYPSRITTTPTLERAKEIAEEHCRRTVVWARPRRAKRLRKHMKLEKTPRWAWGR